MVYLICYVIRRSCINIDIDIDIDLGGDDIIDVWNISTQKKLPNTTLMRPQSCLKMGWKKKLYEMTFNCWRSHNHREENERKENHIASLFSKISKGY